MYRFASSFVTVLFLLLLTFSPAQGAPTANMLIYCGISMVRPMTDIARLFEATENVKITIAQGGSEDLYQSAKKSRKGDLYLPGEPIFRTKHLPEGLLGEYRRVGYNQMAMLVQKGNPKNVRPELSQLLRNDLAVALGSSESGSVGVEAQRILEKGGLYKKVAAKAALFLPDSRSLMQVMRRGEVDVTLSWRATGYFPETAKYVDVLNLPASVAPQHELQLVLLNFSENIELAKKFMAFAAGPQGEVIFRRYGFITRLDGGK